MCLVVLSRVIPPDAVAFARAIPGSVLAAKAALRAQSATKIGLRWAVGGSRDLCVRVGGSSSIFLVVLSWVVPPDSVAFARPGPVSGLAAMCAFLSQCNPAWGIACGRAFSGCNFSAASDASRIVCLFCCLGLVQSVLQQLRSCASFQLQAGLQRVGMWFCRMCTCYLAYRLPNGAYRPGLP